MASRLLLLADCCTKRLVTVVWSGKMSVGHNPLHGKPSQVRAGEVFGTLGQRPQPHNPLDRKPSQVRAGEISGTLGQRPRLAQRTSAQRGAESLVAPGKRATQQVDTGNRPDRGHTWRKPSTRLAGGGGGGIVMCSTSSTDHHSIAAAS